MKPGVHVSFDLENDGELYEQLLAESRVPSANFTVVSASSRSTPVDTRGERLRCQIREADQVIVICGEHTGQSASVRTELRFAQEEETPYILLWGRRDAMCKKPVGTRSTEAIYSWTPSILKDQINETLRKAVAEAASQVAREAKALRTQS